MSTGASACSKGRSSRPASTRTASASSTPTRASSRLDALDRDFDLRWLYVKKTVDGRPAVQLERLYHQIAWELDDDVPRGAADRAARAVLPDQGARGPRRARNPGCARCSRPPCSTERGSVKLGRALARASRAACGHTPGTKPARSRHTSSRSVEAWACSGSCSPLDARDAASPGRRSAARAPGRSIRVAPPVCERCGCPGAWPVRRCVECSGRRLAFARARGALVYDARARPLVSAWKERGRRDLARPLAEIVAEVVARPDVDVVTFVPGDRERGRERGHVPAARLAQTRSASSGACP